MTRYLNLCLFLFWAVAVTIFHPSAAELSQKPHQLGTLADRLSQNEPFIKADSNGDDKNMNGPDKEAIINTRPPLWDDANIVDDDLYKHEIQDKDKHPIPGNYSSTTNTDKSTDGEIPPPVDSWSTIDTLVAIFFVVAAIWLISATVYSIILLILLRLQARGELDIYDENLGRLSLCGGRFNLHFGCILRRYAIQLEQEYHRRLNQRNGASDGRQNEEPTPIRIMTREERRKAIEELLGLATLVDTKEIEDGNNEPNKIMSGKPKCAMQTPCSPTRSINSMSDEEPICSICLAEYESSDAIFKSATCSHMFHRECLMGWLERRNNTECPCCRDPLVSDADVWDAVQRMRKERGRLLRQENGLVHRCVNWILSRRQRRQQPSLGDPNSTTSMSSSSDAIDPESQ